MKSKSILAEADSTVNSTRQDEYGDPVENAVREAIVATVTRGKLITPSDVTGVKLAFKLVRSGRGHKRDTNVDIAGYAEINERVQSAEQYGDTKTIARRLLQGLI
jgi:hypothetical protein